jgi:transcriptional regulator
MLIHPWDASLDTAEWQQWLAETDRFGMLVVNNVNPAQAPVLVPTHFTVAGEELLMHLGPAQSGVAALGGRHRGPGRGDR